jgi:hypothetical protein
MDYSGIKLSLQNWLHDTSAEVVGLVDTFIQLGEARLNRDLRSPKMITTVTGTFAQTIALPSDFQEIFSFNRVDSATTWTPIDPASFTAIRNGAIGYCFTSAGLNTSPFLQGNYELAYYQKLPSIVINSTNLILSAHPDLYLYACLLEASVFIRDEKEGQFYAKYNELLNSVNISESKVGQRTQMKADINVP